jgi:hypothetical protein
MRGLCQRLPWVDARQRHDTNHSRSENFPH